MTYLLYSADCSNGLSNAATGGENTGGVPLWYVEDVSEPRTKLETRFSDLQIKKPPP
jgi:hypothetical protein